MTITELVIEIRGCGHDSLSPPPLGDSGLQLMFEFCHVRLNSLSEAGNNSPVSLQLLSEDLQLVEDLRTVLTSIKVLLSVVEVLVGPVLTTHLHHLLH